MEVLNLDMVSKAYGKHLVLDNINFSINKGEVYGLVGNNGEGKTTLMRTALGLIKPRNGKVMLNSQKKFVGYMPQRCRFNESATVKRVIDFFANQRGVSPEKSYKLCNIFKLEISDKVKVLSPGQQKKLQLVLAAIGEPDIYILDEPTAGLDPAGTDEVLKMINDIRKQENSILISSHILEDLSNICTHIAILKDGKIKYNEKVRETVQLTVGDISFEQIQGMKHRLGTNIENENQLINIECDRQKIPSIIKYCVELEIDVFEITSGNIRKLTLSIMEE